ncbi:MAG: hypothetical protein MUF54_19335 [Polyangiaceae bacterium]|nr:hypothetical protein [Polyangiaceae bacterium]
MTGVSIVPARPEHEAWIYDTFRRALSEVPGWGIDRADDEGQRLIALAPHLALVVATPVGYPDEIAGWAAGARDKSALVAVYVRYTLRRRGIGTELRRAVCDADPAPLAYWTRAAGRMEARGYPWRHDLDASARTLRRVE